MIELLLRIGGIVFPVFAIAAVGALWGRRHRPDMSVVIRGDAQGSFQNVASVLTACREAGVSDMGIAVRTETKQR